MNLPADGRTLYITLYGYAGDWSVQDSAQYTAATLTSARIAAPSKGSTLSGADATFTWTAETTADSYQLWIGSTPDSFDITYAGTTDLQATFSNLPTDGRTLYATLYGYAGGFWSVQDTAQYTAAP